MVGGQWIICGTMSIKVVPRYDKVILTVVSQNSGKNPLILPKFRPSFVAPTHMPLLNVSYCVTISPFYSYRRARASKRKFKNKWRKTYPKKVADGIRYGSWTTFRAYMFAAQCCVRINKAFLSHVEPFSLLHRSGSAMAKAASEWVSDAGLVRPNCTVLHWIKADKWRTLMIAICMIMESSTEPSVCVCGCVHLRYSFGVSKGLPKYHTRFVGCCCCYCCQEMLFIFPWSSLPASARESLSGLQSKRTLRPFWCALFLSLFLAQNGSFVLLHSSLWFGKQVKRGVCKFAAAIFRFWQMQHQQKQKNTDDI